MMEYGRSFCNYKEGDRIETRSEHADLVQDGYFGFLKAIDTYDPVEHPDISFSTWVIIRCVGEWSKYLRDCDPLVEADSLDSQLSCIEKDTTADKNA